MPGDHFCPLSRTTENASIFKIWENRMGLSFSSVFKPIQQTSPYHISKAVRMSVHSLKAQETALLITSYRRCQEAGVDPYPTVETTESLKK